MLGLLLIGLITGLLAGMLGETFGLIIGGILYIGLLIPMISASTRRLHDTSRSGWWQLIGIIPLVSLVLIYFYVVSGDAGDNLYGSPPT